MAGILTRRENRDIDIQKGCHVKTEAETGTSCKPRDAKGCQGPPEAEKSKERSCLLPRECGGLADAWISSIFSRTVK